MKPTRDPHETAALIAGIAGVRNLGARARLLEALALYPCDGDPGASLCLDLCLHDSAPELAAGAGRRCSPTCAPTAQRFSAPAAALRSRSIGCLHLGGERRARARDESRLFHVAACECAPWRDFLARTPQSCPARFGAPREWRGLLPDLRLRGTPMGGS